MKTKKTLFALVASLVLASLAAIGVGCSNPPDSSSGDPIPKSYSFEGVLFGEKEFPAFLELQEGGSVSLEYIMTMGQEGNTAHTVIAAEGSWTQDVLGRVNSVKFMSNGDEYEAVVDKKAGTITIGYSLDFATFTVSVSDVKTGEGAKNIVISTVAKAE